MKYKLDFVNKGQEFELPNINEVGVYRKLLEIEANVESKYKNLDKESKTTKTLIGTEANIETAYYVLNKIDKNVTKENIEKTDGTVLAKFILALYGIKEKNFQKATKEVAKQQKKN